MKSRSQNTYHIVRCVGKQKMRPPSESNQPRVEKCSTGSATSLEKHSDGNQAKKNKEKDKRQKTKDKNGAERITKK